MYSRYHSTMIRLNLSTETYFKLHPSKYSILYIPTILNQRKAAPTTPTRPPGDAFATASALALSRSTGAHSAKTVHTMEYAMPLAHFRDEFPVFQHAVYLNHAAIAPLPRRSVEATTRYLHDRMTHGGVHIADWLATRDAARTRTAALLGAQTSEIAFTGNTSLGLATVANGMAWREDDAVIVSAPDFPTVHFAWRNLERHGVAVVPLQRREGRLLPEDLARLLETTPNVRLVMVASVDFATGAACDLPALGALCRDHGALFCVDAIQTLGAAPLDVRAAHIDFLAAGGHKWLLGPIGFGVLYVAAHRLETLHPATVGWNSVVNGESITLDFTLKEDASRYEPGTQDIASLHGFEASLGLLEEAGVWRIREHILALTDAIAAGCRERGLRVVSPWSVEERSGIVSVAHPQAASVVEGLAKRGVVASLRDGRLRLSPHMGNTVADVDALFAALDDMS